MDKEYYGVAALEVAQGYVDAALMVKALALAGGDEGKGRALYIQLRAEELRAQHRQAKFAAGTAATAKALGATAVATATVAGAAITTAATGVGKLVRFLLWAGVAVFALYVLISVIGGTSRPTQQAPIGQAESPIPASYCAPGTTYNPTTSFCERPSTSSGQQPSAIASRANSDSRGSSYSPIVNYSSPHNIACQEKFQASINAVPQDASLGHFASVQSEAQARLDKCIQR